MATKEPRLGQFELVQHVVDVLLGILTAQTYSFYRKSEDCKLLKGLVGCIWVLFFASTTCTWYGLYEATIVQSSHPNKDQSTEVPTLNGIPTTLAAFLGPLVQAFFIHRIQRFSGTILIPAIYYALSVVYLVLGLSTAVGSFFSGDILSWDRTWSAAYTAQLILGATIDIILTATLCYYLLVRRKYVYKRTTKLLDKMIIWIISTGLVTSIFAWITTITFFTSFNTYQWIFWNALTTRSFPVSLLTALLVRSKFRAVAVESAESSTDGPPMPMFRKTGTDDRNNMSNPGLVITYPSQALQKGRPHAELKSLSLSSQGI